MIYVIFGQQYPVIKKRVKKIIQANLTEPSDDFNTVYFNARTTTVQNIVLDARSLPLGSDHKIIVVENPYFLVSPKEKVNIEKEQNYDKLKEFIANGSEYCDMIFMVIAKSIDTKSEIVKLLQKHAKIQEEVSLTPDQLIAQGEKFFAKYDAKISNDALKELVSRVDGDLGLFMNEAEKLALFSKNITIKDVRKMTSMKLEQNAFQIADNLIHNKIDEALKTYYDLRLFKEEPVRLIALLATQFRTLSEVAYLSTEKNMNQEQIAKTIGIHPYRVKLALQNLRNINYSQVLKIINELYILDSSIKKGEIDPYLGFELFMIKFKGFKNEVEYK